MNAPAGTPDLENDLALADVAAFLRRRFGMILISGAAVAAVVAVGAGRRPHTFERVLTLSVRLRPFVAGTEDAVQVEVSTEEVCSGRLRQAGDQAIAALQAMKSETEAAFQCSSGLMTVTERSTEASALEKGDLDALAAARAGLGIAAATIVEDRLKALDIAAEKARQVRHRLDSEAAELSSVDRARRDALYAEWARATAEAAAAEAESRRLSEGRRNLPLLTSDLFPLDIVGDTQTRPASRINGVRLALVALVAGAAAGIFLAMLGERWISFRKRAGAL